jgi:hypothetical protein
MPKQEVVEGVKITVDIVFFKNHRLIQFYDYTEIDCPVTEDTYRIFSKKGEVHFYCPGCGEHLVLDKP